MADGYQDEDDFGEETGDETVEGRPYKVGYGRPPVEHQFKPNNKAAAGKRGPRKDKRIKQMVDALLKEKVTVTLNGKRKRISHLEAILRSTIHSAAKSPQEGLRLISWAMHQEPEEAPDWVGSSMTVQFVTRDWSDDLLPGWDKAKESERLRAAGIKRQMQEKERADAKRRDRG